MRRLLAIKLLSMIIALNFAGCGSVTKQPTEPAIWEYDYVATYQSSYPAVMTPGQTTTVTIEVKNVGSATWFNIGPSKMALGTGSKYGTSEQSYGYQSELSDSSWISDSTPVAISDNEVPTGATTTFEFTLRAPEIVGTYKAYFTPKIGDTPLKDAGIYYQIEVVRSIETF